jgi:S-(hydroxymethyl)glutathione dehydrogenase/alcohol dehydrogenase
VLVEIKASGVCHTDYKTLRRGTPFIIGHEGAGIVRAIGPGVSRARPGDRVLLNWAIPCRQCFQCRRGAENICENKPRVPAERFLFEDRPIETMFNLGTMATHTVVREEAVVRIDVPISFASACILGCGVMTGFGSAVNVAKVQPGASVAVIGTGGVGLSVIQGARIAGAAKIIGVDLKPQRLEMARKFGATHTVPADPELEQAARQVRELTDGRGADYAFECTSVPALGASPLAMVRNGGTAVAISGIEEYVRINMELYEWDKTYLMPLYGQCRPDVDMPKLLRLYEERRLLLDEMVTRTYRLTELPKAFEDMHAGINAKGVLVME